MARGFKRVLIVVLGVMDVLVAFIRNNLSFDP